MRGNGLSAAEERERLARWLRNGEIWLPNSASIASPLHNRGALPAVPFPAGSEGRGA